jgi:endonuclease VIII
VPEGDTVWLVTHNLREALAGSVVTRSDLRVPKLATADLSGRRVEDVAPRGKHIFMRFQGGWTLHSHLRMDGSWRIYEPGARWNGGPAHQIRALLATSSRTAVGYRLPVLELLRTAGEAALVAHLGPDLLGPDWDPGEALRRLTAEPKRPVGDALLDQRTMAGIGNVYKSELCFIAGVTPWTAVGDVPSPALVVESAHRLLDLNKSRTGRVTTDDPRPGRTQWVYDRARRPCLRCGTLIRGAMQGPAEQPGSDRARPTFWCPRCQAGPAPG